MKALADVKTPQDVIERAADIAALFFHADLRQQWFIPPNENRLIWALCEAAYPAPSCFWNDKIKSWWADHIRIRRMDPEVQRIVRDYIDRPLLSPDYRLIKPAELEQLLRACVAEVVGA